MTKAARDLTECPIVPARSKMAGQRRDETSFKWLFMTVLSGLAPTLYVLSQWGGGPTSQRQLCVRQTSPYRKKLFHSTPEVRMWRCRGCFLAGKVKGQEIRETDATGWTLTILWEQKDCRLFAANLENGRTIKYLINISASFSLPLCGYAQTLSTSCCNQTPCTNGLGFPLTSPTAPAEWDPGSQEVPNLCEQMSIFGAKKMSLFLRTTV